MDDLPPPPAYNYAVTEATAPPHDQQTFYSVQGQPHPSSYPPQQTVGISPTVCQQGQPGQSLLPTGIPQLQPGDQHVQPTSPQLQPGHLGCQRHDASHFQYPLGQQQPVVYYTSPQAAHIQGLPPMHTPLTTVVIRQPATIVHLSERPTVVQCRVCQTMITTRVKYTEGNMTWLMVLGLCLVGCWPFCLVPFCLNKFKDVEHTCPNCNQQVGIFRRL